MANLSVVYRRLKKIIFYLIIFYLVRSYYLRRKRGGSGGKRISGPPERKRITDGSEQKSEEKPKASIEEESDNESESESESEDEKVKDKININEEKTVGLLENTETAIQEESKKEDSIDNNISLSETENIQKPKNEIDGNSIDIEKTEIINEIIKDNEIEMTSREVPVINNIEVISSIPEDLKFQVSEQQFKPNIEIEKPTLDEKVMDDIVNDLNETVDELEKNEPHQPEELINKVEEAIEKPETLAAIVEDIIIPNENNEPIIENPEKVDITIDDESSESLEESNGIVENISEEIIEPNIEVVEPVTEEVIQITENNEDEKPFTQETATEEKSSTDQQPQTIESLISEIEKVVQEPESDESIIEEKVESEKVVEPVEPVELVKPKPVNAADIVGHEEIIYEGEIDDEDDGEWIDEDDDGEWIDESDEEVEEVKPEVNNNNKRQSLFINTSMNLSNKPALLMNTPIELANIAKRQSLLLNTPVDILNSLMNQTKSNTSPETTTSVNSTPSTTIVNSLPTPAQTPAQTPSPSPIPTPVPISTSNPIPIEEKPKVLPDDILERIFREVDPQTMYVLRNTSIKTRNIIDNILKETFETYDLSMDPLYFDVTSKDNLGLILNSLNLPPFALAMLLHEILKLDSQHIGYAFGQMFRVPSKINVDYLTDLFIDTIHILKSRKNIDIAEVMLGFQSYYCFNHSEFEFYQLFDLIEMTPEEVGRYIRNHYHFILSKSLPQLLQALDADEVFVAEMCKSYANDDMDAFARIISKVPISYVRTSIHPNDVQGERVVVVNENGEDVIVVLNKDENSPDHGNGLLQSPQQLHHEDEDEDEWVEDDGEDYEDEEEIIEDEEHGDSMIYVENNTSFSIFIGRILRFLNMTTKEVAALLKYLPEYCSYDEDEILEGLNWNEEQIEEMRKIKKDEEDKIAKKMEELSKLIIQRRMSISNGLGSPLTSSSSTNLSSASRNLY